MQRAADAYNSSAGLKANWARMQQNGTNLAYWAPAGIETYEDADGKHGDVEDVMHDVDGSEAYADEGEHIDADGIAMGYNYAEGPRGNDNADGEHGCDEEGDADAFGFAYAVCRAAGGIGWYTNGAGVWKFRGVKRRGRGRSKYDDLAHGPPRYERCFSECCPSAAPA